MSSSDCNRLLESLPLAEKMHLLSRMDRVVLPASTRLYEPQRQPAHAHFMTQGLASIVTFLQDGSSVEVAMVGSEGVVEAAHLLGDSFIPTAGLIQVQGRALRIGFAELKEAFAESPALRSKVLEFVQLQSSIMSQAAACNRRHRMEQRLAKWLLMMHDRVGEPRFTLFLEFMAEMIGTENQAASRAAAYLQKQGLLLYSGGEVQIIDRERLEKAACECYPLLQNLWLNLYA